VVITGELYDEIQVDGTYLRGSGLCLLTAVNGDGEVVNWQWCNSESTAAYEALLAPIPPPLVVVCDGGQGLKTALKNQWPETRVQRCLVHVQRNIRTNTTLNPRTDAGKAMRALSLKLTRIKTIDQAIEWQRSLEAWYQLYGHLIHLKTFAETDGVLRPIEVKAGKKWWWTHERLRKSWFLLSRLNREDVLFTYLTPEFEGLGISSTTNHLEGGVNSMIKGLLYDHRGMPSAHQMRAVDWWCYLHSPAQKPPVAFMKPEHWTTPERRQSRIREPKTDLEIPGGIGTGINLEDGGEGVWIRKGWAGRRS
jgi:hypothetical protein